MIYPDIDPVILSLGPLKVHWYGMMYLIAFSAAWWLGQWRAKLHADWTREQMDDLLFYGALGVVLGGRLGYIFFYNFSNFIDNPLILIRIWEGGMSFHGGLIGVALSLFLFARKYHKNVFDVFDFCAPLVPIGLVSGRIGNFINGELWGKASDLPWAMQLPCAQFPQACAASPYDAIYSPALHPSMLYEALFEGVVLFIIVWLFSSKVRPRMTVAGIFLLGYGIFRFALEFIRTPDAHLGYLAFDWLTMGQILSTPMIGLGIAFIWFGFSQPKNRST